MTQPVSYVELSSPDIALTTDFFARVFGWDLQPFAAADYFVAPHGEAPGIDAGILASRDGAPRTVPIIRVDALDDACARVASEGGTVVVAPFTLPGVGRGCYVNDPAGLLIGLHEYDPSST